MCQRSMLTSSESNAMTLVLSLLPVNECFDWLHKELSFIMALVALPKLGLITCFPNT